MNELMKRMGFMVYVSSSENESERFPPILFERQLSFQTSLIVEAELNGNGERYTYSFYKIKYVYRTNSIKEIKVYLSGGSREYLLQRVYNWLVHEEMISYDVALDLKNKIRIRGEKKFGEQYKQKQIDKKRKRMLGVM